MARRSFFFYLENSIQKRWYELFWWARLTPFDILMYELGGVE